MPQIGNIERRIEQVEGFAVRIRTSDGADIRSDRVIAAHYPYERRAFDDVTVATWTQTRFARSFVGLSVEVLDGNGRATHGRTHLGTVRGTYA